MKSKRAKEYIEENTEYADNLVDLYGWGLFDVVEEYDARHAIEIAEEEMAEEAGRLFEQFMSGVFQGDTLKKMAEEFKRRLLE